MEANTVDQEDVERFSRIAEEWWDENGKFRPLHRINPVRLQYIRDQACAHFGRDPQKIRPLAGLRLLDVGCGGGLLAEPFTRLGATVTAIDASDKNIRVASLHAQKMGLSIDYRNTTPEQLVAEGMEAYDIVLALEVVEHVADVTAFLNACTKLVKPEGMLFMSTLNRTIKSYAFAIAGAEYVLRWLPRGTHQWKKFLKPAELCSGLRRQNMRVTHMTGMAFNPLQNSWSLDERDLDVNYLLAAIPA
ncbi:MAG TPA: bifunctional 2-polyprenyl-6-hydroxyphenol methylase/3-demethylubiquinol 3-O-methyltransferase UbiG [Rickettsiales bacterium]|nr:bifunctional 2-polyprenyl-6-hydroxyphenol methylase/3-demethylubiquinol 3-O-methyltransferase UbiG [Rickettsiales bacterium]